MPYDNLFAAALARKAKVKPDSIPVLPESNTPRSDILATVGAPMPEFNTERVFQALDQPRNQLFKILSGIDKERVGGTDVLEKFGMNPGIGREALGLFMDTGADPLNALTGVPSAIKKIKDIRRLADLAKSTQTVAPMLNEGVSVARSNLLDAVESPAFQRQGRSIEGIEDLLGAQRGLADKTPMAAPVTEFPKTPFEEIRPGSKLNLAEGQPEAVSSLVERMMAARKAAPEDLSIIQQSYGEMPGNTAQDLLREGRRTEQELIRAKQQAAKEAMLRELSPQSIGGTPASPSGVIEGLKKLGYSDNEIVKMTGQERQNLWELGAPSPSSFERELTESLDTPGAGMVETPSISTGLEKQPWEMTSQEFSRKIVFHGKGETHPLYGKSKVTGGFSDKYSVASDYATGIKRDSKGEVHLLRRSALPIGARQDMVDRKAFDLVTGMGIEPATSIVTIPPHLENPHKYIVERALSEGKTVPEKVLSEYPDLAEQVVGQIPTQPPATVEESIQTLFPNRVQVFPKREQPR